MALGFAANPMCQDLTRANEFKCPLRFPCPKILTERSIMEHTISVLLSFIHIDTQWLLIKALTREENAQGLILCM